MQIFAAVKAKIVCRPDHGMTGWTLGFHTYIVYRFRNKYLFFPPPRWKNGFEKTLQFSLVFSLHLRGGELLT